jgi:AcrR family transcriptional regulator
MSGKPQFDEAAVIAAALDVFWHHGYTGASINQLTIATGLSRSSLYPRFQDKDGLFQEALAAYIERLLHRAHAVRADTARGRLQALLREFLPPEGRSRKPPGCLLARSCSELADLPAAGQSLVIAGLKRQRTMLEELLREAVANGELPPDADAVALSWYYLGVLQSLLNLPSAGATAAQLRGVAEAAMAAWPDVVAGKGVGARAV